MTPPAASPGSLVLARYGEGEDRFCWARVSRLYRARGGEQRCDVEWLRPQGGSQRGDLSYVCEDGSDDTEHCQNLSASADLRRPGPAGRGGEVSPPSPRSSSGALELDAHGSLRGLVELRCTSPRKVPTPCAVMSPVGSLASTPPQSPRMGGMFSTIGCHTISLALDDQEEYCGPISYTLSPHDEEEDASPGKAKMTRTPSARLSSSGSSPSGSWPPGGSIAGEAECEPVFSWPTLQEPTGGAPLLEAPDLSEQLRDELRGFEANPRAKSQAAKSGEGASAEAPPGAEVARAGLASDIQLTQTVVDRLYSQLVEVASGVAVNGFMQALGHMYAQLNQGCTDPSLLAINESSLEFDCGRDEEMRAPSCCRDEELLTPPRCGAELGALKGACRSLVGRASTRL